MESEQDNNKRIAKNTLFLYLRMIVVMLITLYTSRILLEVLGVEDFGVYNAIGGFNCNVCDNFFFIVFCNW